MMIKSIQNERGNNPSSLTPNPSSFTFPPSVQSDLFGYLKPYQQAILKPYLRLIKRPYQEKLCISLLDYLEGNGLDGLQQPVLRSLQHHIIEVCNLHPFTSSRAAGSKFQVSGFRAALLRVSGFMFQVPGRHRPLETWNLDLET